ncbi:MAG TPA: hypothetical protein VD969_21440 [Symbiobacteriaceae bacterium]|nr:hypothetical protein [Symbiobacteriaceae bacterium]
MTGPIQIAMMDREIKKATGGKKSIDDLMAALWNRYKGPNQVIVSDEQVLGLLRELTGLDWHPFYEQHVLRTDSLDVSALDDVKADWPAWVKATSDYWYDGHPSAYIVDMELIGAAGSPDFGVRWQPREWPLYQFVKEARQLRDVTKSDLTEADVITALNKVTGKNHQDFFSFYRGQGLAVDLAEISAFVRMPAYRGESGMDTGARLLPDRWVLGGETPVRMELTDPTYATAPELILQVTAFDRPRAGALKDLITGPDAAFSYDIPGINAGQYGTIDQYFWRITPRQVDGKTVADFTVRMPADAGLLSFRLHAQSAEGKALAQSGLTVRFRQPTP